MARDQKENQQEHYTSNHSIGLSTQKSNYLYYKPRN